MFKSGRQVSAQDKLDRQQQQQKQKKRLSFREPEIEGPQIQGGCRPKISLSSTPTKGFGARRNSSSVEDLLLEDQALHIAQSVGNAFSNRVMKVTDRSDYSDQLSFNNNTQQEIDTDCSSAEYATYQRRCQQRSFKISPQDQEYLETNASSVLDTTMRCPSIEGGELNHAKTYIPSEVHEDKYPRGAQHQIQLLKYQLDQQNQQTQMALHQVQLLTDQMEAESCARRNAQEQNNQLMMQNKDLLDHMEKLFQQIEDLEKQIKEYEKEKISRMPQVSQTAYKSTSSFPGYRRLSSDQSMLEKPATSNRSQITAPKKSSLTSTKPALTSSKLSTSSNPPSKRSSLASPRQYSTQNKPTESTTSSKYSTQQAKGADTSNKGKELLRIGDSSPPVQSGTMSPFGSGWKLNSSAAEKSGGITSRNRTGSFSSFGKVKTQDTTSAKSTLFGNSFSSNSSKKYSSSTSDLYSNPSSIQMNKSLVIDEPLTNTKSAISNLNLTPPSKLPRYQAFSSYQRRTSVSNDSEQNSSTDKETYKNKSETSFFNR